MSINIISGMTKNHVIGKENKLPWHIPEDLQNFKKITAGNVIVMGRKTYESIGKPLPNRVNIVISRDMPPTQGLVICRNVPEAVEEAKKYNKEVFIVGGATIYEQALPFTDKMYLSHIKKEYDGDAYFPEFNEADWNIIKREDHAEFELVVYERKKKE